MVATRKRSYALLACLVLVSAFVASAAFATSMATGFNFVKGLTNISDLVRYSIAGVALVIGLVGGLLMYMAKPQWHGIGELLLGVAVIALFAANADKFVAVFGSSACLI